MKIQAIKQVTPPYKERKVPVLDEKWTKEKNGETKLKVGNQREASCERGRMCSADERRSITTSHI
ncbi:Sec7 domain-containing protein [Sesbania bispinosa]|nr:Sec7 domain-containing protein [Sesbania bispinosa]